MNIFISCGETSGDRYASELLAVLKKIEPDLTVHANGGENLERSGAIITCETTSKSTIGFIEPLRHLGFFINAMRRTKSVIIEKKISLVIIIDHQGFNIPLAKWCKKKNIKVVSLFAPQFWMWGNVKNGVKFVNYCDLIATVFKKEHDFYNSLSPEKTTFIGHPLVHEVPHRNKPENQILGLFPGSRKQEIELLLPVMLDVAKAIKDQFPKLILKLAVSSEQFKDEISQMITMSELDIETVSDSRRLIANATCSIVSSGTVTLEHALIGTPCVAIYKFKPVSYAIAHFFVMKKIEENCDGFIAMPNILAKRKILSEFLQNNATTVAIADEINQLLSNNHYYQQVEADFLNLKQSLQTKDHPLKILAEKIAAIA